MAVMHQARRPGRSALAFLNDATFRAIAYQVLVAAALVLCAWYLVSNTATNMAERGLTAGFGFLDSSAGFGIGFTLIEYREGDTYWRVFQVGMANTLLVAAISCILATVLGLFVGLARLSSNWLIRTLARVYIEVLRNTPLLLQIIAWFIGVFSVLPRPRDSHVWFDIFALNNRGFYMPAPVPHDGFGALLTVIALALAGAVALRIWAKRRQDRTGQLFPAVPVGLLLVVGTSVVGYYTLGRPVGWDIPELRGFNFRGGLGVPPAFCALVIALSVYTSCFIGEIVRSGIQSVGRGQTEAAKSLNLKPAWTMRLIILPQALRVIIPPLISQYLNVTKNSSLAIAIGFPDLVSVWMNTSLNQSGRAIPIVVMTMAFYCAVSLTVSLVLNIYNSRVMLKER
ncbi:MAG: amino acid ABC transporter permease [Guyparkeria sp.]